MDQFDNFFATNEELYKAKEAEMGESAEFPFSSVTFGKDMKINNTIRNDAIDRNDPEGDIIQREIRTTVLHVSTFYNDITEDSYVHENIVAADGMGSIVTINNINTLANPIILDDTTKPNVDKQILRIGDTVADFSKCAYKYDQRATKTFNILHAEQSCK